MYERISEEKNFNTKMKFAKAVLRNDYAIMNAEEALYDFVGKNSASFFYKLIHPDYEQEFLSVCQSMKPGEKYSVITMLRDKDEYYHPVDIHISRSKPMEDGDWVYLLDIYGIDMIELSFLDNQQKLDKYRAFMGIAGLVYMEYWPDTKRIVFYNYVVQKACILVEGDIDEWHEKAIRYGINRGSNLAEIEQWYENMASVANQFSCVVKTGFLNSNHVPETLEVNARFISKHNMDVLVGVIHRKDITDDDIPYYLTPAGKDAATNLLNKRALIEYTNDKLCCANNKNIYMILIDIDDFKIINDTHGHLMGDKAILILSETITEVLDGRGIAGRFGGDEFFILTEELPDEQQLRLFLKAMLSKLRLNQAKKLPGIRYTLSMGIAKYPEDGKTFNDLFMIADKALYIAKDKGKNRYIIYRPELHDSIDVVGRQTETGIYPIYIKTLKNVMRELLVDGSENIVRILGNVKEAFGLGAIAVHYGERFEHDIYAGECPESIRDITFMLDESYRKLLAGENVLVMNNLSGVLRRDTYAYNMLLQADCQSYISIMLPDTEHPKFVAAFYIFGTKHKWSSTEENYITMIAEAVYLAVCGKSDKNK